MIMGKAARFVELSTRVAHTSSRVVSARSVVNISAVRNVNDGPEQSSSFFLNSNQSQPQPQSQSQLAASNFALNNNSYIGNRLHTYIRHDANPTAVQTAMQGALRFQSSLLVDAEQSVFSTENPFQPRAGSFQYLTAQVFCQFAESMRSDPSGFQAESLKVKGRVHFNPNVLVQEYALSEEERLEKAMASMDVRLNKKRRRLERNLKKLMSQKAAQNPEVKAQHLASPPPLPPKRSQAKAQHSPQGAEAKAQHLASPPPLPPKRSQAKVQHSPQGPEAKAQHLASPQQSTKKTKWHRLEN